MVQWTISSNERREHKRAAEVTAPLSNPSILGKIRALAISICLPYHRRRTGGRVVDGTALEMRRACKGSVGSNPTLSANYWPSRLSLGSKLAQRPGNVSNRRRMQRSGDE